MKSASAAPEATMSAPLGEERVMVKSFTPITVTSKLFCSCVMRELKPVPLPKVTFEKSTKSPDTHPCAAF